jgi:antitoxin CptB
MACYLTSLGPRGEEKRADIVALRLYIKPRPARPGYWHLEIAVTGRSSDGLDERRRRLLFRSWHRGIREVDLVLGRFADAALETMSAADMDDYERLLEVPTPDLLAFVMGELPIPDDETGPLLRRMIDFHSKAKRSE